MRFLALVLVFVFALAAKAEAHGIRSAFLNVTAQDATHAVLTLNSPAPASGIEFAVPANCTLADRTVLECPNGLRGAELEVRGMGPIVSETSVVVELEGETMSHLLTASSPRWTIPSHESAWSVARQYVGLGVTHILGGADHLLFLLGLVLVVRKLRAVLIAETAFTISHTISFSATALGIVRIPSGPAEACIAVSLVLVALDIGRPTSMLHRKGFADLAFAFGLVHGLGFAGALREVGLPEKAILPALAGFAGGIELGQIAFLAAVMLLVHLVSKTRMRRAIDLSAAYAIGAVGCFWLIQRLH
jgi:hypothetical protein